MPPPNQKAAFIWRVNHMTGCSAAGISKHPTSIPISSGRDPKSPLCKFILKSYLTSDEDDNLDLLEEVRMKLSLVGFRASQKKRK